MECVPDFPNTISEQEFQSWWTIQEDENPSLGNLENSKPIYTFPTPKKRKHVPSNGSDTFSLLDKNVLLKKYSDVIQERELLKTKAQRLENENHDFSQRMEMLIEQLNAFRDQSATIQELLHQNEELRQINFVLSSHVLPAQHYPVSPQEVIAISSDSEDSSSDCEPPLPVPVLCIKRPSLSTKMSIQSLGYKVVETIVGRDSTTTLVTNPFQKSPELLYAIAYDLTIVSDSWLSNVYRPIEDFVVNGLVYSIDTNLYKDKTLKIQGYNGNAFKEEWQKLILAILFRLGLSITYSTSEAHKIIQPFAARRLQNGVNIERFLDEILIIRK